MKKKAYVILGRKNRFIYGAFPRTKDGHIRAKLYKNDLVKSSKLDLIIK